MIGARRLPVGAEVMADGGVHFRVWAPKHKLVEALVEGNLQGEPVERFTVRLSAEGNGYFSGESRDAKPGDLYRYLLDGGGAFPDPASRFQPIGPHGPSCIIDPAYPWSDTFWSGISPEGNVIYEMHLGTFTCEGNWQGAIKELPLLAELGITVIEVMPVADFPGRFGWGYDGVNLFAPTRLYGRPDDFRAFVDMAHGCGLGVILDVVYNHLGPEGNYLQQFSDSYFTDRYRNEWGEAVNFDGEGSGPVREFFIANAAYWIEEFHLDGLRVDATQQIYDASFRHILACINEKVRQAAGAKSVFLVGENEPQQIRCLLPVDEDGFGFDVVWNDDFHHCAHAAVTGYNEAYYSEYLGTPQELVSAVKYGYLYQGQRYFWQDKRRGSSTRGVRRSAFVNFIQNHDQVANSAWGFRIHQLTSPGSFRAITTLLLLAPGTPMLFQGQEFAASTPFLYFADLSAEVTTLVRKGRVEFLSQFTNIASAEVIESLDSPAAFSTFERSCLHPEEREKHHRIFAMHRDLLRLRREDVVFSAGASSFVDGAVLGPEGFVIRYLYGEEERLLLVNLGRELKLRPAPEPLLAPPGNGVWNVLWSSERPEYGGSGYPEPETENFWRILGHAAVVLAPAPTGGGL
ncbi:malto-oligosyltrehalose trehalohydrolase [Geotalea sp. SG265]|uniref:malto-oligosyltrehalose trehalohydrolase n=1 Tax=Geotalea sp. SG265 TaxID=2922867 RepID=UPI001FAF2419|nr:malto-oligosyltrehalose trehalohydrolase [Geotalea sp. SG265]